MKYQLLTGLYISCVGIDMYWSLSILYTKYLVAF